MMTSGTPPRPDPPGKPAGLARSVRKPLSPIDWDAIERDYRSGIPSVREIASKFGVSHTAINKQADKEGWTSQSGQSCPGRD